MLFSMTYKLGGQNDLQMTFDNWCKFCMDKIDNFENTFLLNFTDEKPFLKEIFCYDMYNKRNKEEVQMTFDDSYLLHVSNI